MGIVAVASYTAILSTKPRANNYDSVYNKAYFIVHFTRIQAGRREEKVTQSWHLADWPEISHWRQY